MPHPLIANLGFLGWVRLFIGAALLVGLIVLGFFFALVAIGIGLIAAIVVGAVSYFRGKPVVRVHSTYSAQNSGQNNTSGPTVISGEYSEEKSDN